MQLLRHLSIRWKLLLLVLTPAAGLFYFSAQVISDNHRTASDLAALAEMTELSVEASRLVHELQKERGMTAGYLGSLGSDFSEEIRQQYQLTDTAYASLKEFLELHSSFPGRDAMLGHIQQAEERLTGLTELRGTVQELTADTSAAIDFYTGTNAIYLDMIASLQKQAGDPALSNMAAAYIAFLNSKERAGIERAVLANTFSADMFGPGMYNKLLNLISIQNTYMDEFRSLAGAEALRLLDDTLQGEYIDETARLRQLAIAGGDTGNFGVDATYWFRMQTGKINLLKQIENALSDSIISSAHHKQSQAQATFRNSLLMLGLIALLTLLAGYIIQRIVCGALGSAVRIADSIASGNMDNSFDYNGRDETGSLIRSLEAMQQQLRKLFDEQQSQVIENNRIRQALNAASANVLLTDVYGKVLYVNRTFRKLLEDHSDKIAAALPGFSVANLKQGSVAIFDPACAGKGFLTHLRQHRSLDLHLGDLQFHIDANPVTDTDGGNIGIVFQWTDLTEQNEALQQISAVLEDASRGRLDSRLDSERFSGFIATLSDGVNRLLDAIVGPLSRAAECIRHISDGNMPEPIQEQYDGDFAQLRDNLNTCIESINRLVNDSRRLSEHAVQGKLGSRADSRRHHGDFRNIVEGINAALNAMAEPVQDCKQVMNRMQDGDLTSLMRTDCAGEFGELAQAVNASIMNIRELVAEILFSARNISTAASEVAQGSCDLNIRTEQQAAGLEETSANLEQLVATVQQSTTLSGNAHQLAITTRERAARGGELVTRADHAMSEISKSSLQIAEIISVIDSISFQTNLLALNASVEAARAGESGKGFAVVASEVGELARRSANAAGEIKSIIQDSTRKVEDGARLVRESGTTLTEIVEAVTQVCQATEEISGMNNEQADGIVQINETMTQIDEMTQQNAALVEETSSASAALDDQAKKLESLVGTFTTEGGETGTVPLVPAAPAPELRLLA